MAIFNFTQDMLSPWFFSYLFLFSTSSGRWSTFEVHFIHKKIQFFPHVLVGRIKFITVLCFSERAAG